MSNGLASDFVNTAYRDRNGLIWLGTFNGLSRLDPKSERPQPAPPIVISGLSIAGVEQPLSEFGSAALSGMELSATQNNLQIDFLSLSLADAELLRYQYRLEGADADWIPPTDQRTVNYAKLAPGKYRFLVRAVNADGVTSERPASIEFVILRPVWQRWWFLTLAAILIGLVAYTLYRYRVARFVELERVRTRIATDLHDDIGSSLSRIAIMSEVVRQQIDGVNPQAAEPLSKIALDSRELVDSMSDIVWAINPKKDHLHDLTQRKRRFASDVFTARNIEFTLRAPGAGQDVRLDVELRRQVFLIFKEAVNNMVRHSACTEAEIEFQLEGHDLLLVLSDNGKGFDPARSENGHGLMSMTERARTLGGELVVTSNGGEGTTVTLKVPIARPQVLSIWALTVASHSDINRAAACKNIGLRSSCGHHGSAPAKEEVAM